MEPRQIVRSVIGQALRFAPVVLRLGGYAFCIAAAVGYLAAWTGLESLATFSRFRGWPGIFGLAALLTVWVWDAAALTALVRGRKLRAMHTKVAGVSFHQSQARRCRPGKWVGLRREPGNSHDPNAVAIRCGIWRLGYLNKMIAQEMSERVEAGGLHAVITKVTGGTAGKSTVGVNLALVISDVPVPQRLVRMYGRRLVAEASKQTD